MNREIGVCSSRVEEEIVIIDPGQQSNDCPAISSHLLAGSMN